jgi:hypothetical protein
MEIDLSADADDDFENWRRLTLAAYSSDGAMDDLPEEDCDDMSEWEFLVECLSDRVLWDADYEGGDNFLDSSPELACEMRGIFGIDDEYFLDVPPDPRETQLPLIRDKLKQLCG